MAGSNGSRDSSRDSKRAKPSSRPPTPKASLASVTVPMGGVAYLDRATHRYTMYETVNRDTPKKTEGEAIRGRYGLYTNSMSDCFTVIVGGSGGAILTHVSAYLGHRTLGPREQAEFKGMKASFAKLWDAHKRELEAHIVVIIEGEHTNKAQMMALIPALFPQLKRSLGQARFSKCEDAPFPRTESHGTAMVLVNQAGTEVFREDRQVL